MSWSLRAAFVVLSVALPIGNQTTDGDPKDATGWFIRARDLFNLRAPDAAPFHMRVQFHAYPGIEVQKKTEIVAGDGTYDEVWMSPRQWRREVTLNGYHAVEVQSERQRRMQATSDYEPSRVLMLMEALLDPVPRNLIEPDLNDIPLGWKLEHRTAGTLAFVSISRHWTIPSNTFGFGYLMLPGGMLVQSDQAGLATGWQDEVNFAGKAAPRRITVRAGDRVLLSADVTVQASGAVAPATFELDGSCRAGHDTAPTAHLRDAWP